MQMNFGKLVWKISYLLIIKKDWWFYKIIGKVLISYGKGKATNLFVTDSLRYWWTLTEVRRHKYIYAWNSRILPLAFDKRCFIRVKFIALSFGSLSPSSKYNKSTKRFVYGPFEFFMFRFEFYKFSILIN